MTRPELKRELTHYAECELYEHFTAVIRDYESDAEYEERKGNEEKARMHRKWAKEADELWSELFHIITSHANSIKED